MKKPKNKVPPTPTEVSPVTERLINDLQSLLDELEAAKQELLDLEMLVELAQQEEPEAEHHRRLREAEGDAFNGRSCDWSEQE
jgi:hypothetical protein